MWARVDSTYLARPLSHGIDAKLMINLADYGSVSLMANSSSPPPLPKKRAKLFDIRPTWLRDLHHQMQVPKLCEVREEVYSATTYPPIWPSGAGVLCFASGGRSLPPASGSTGTAGTTTITCQKRLNSYPLPRPFQGGLWWKRTLSLLLPPQARSSLLPTSHLPLGEHSLDLLLLPQCLPSPQWQSQLPARQ